MGTQTRSDTQRLAAETADALGAVQSVYDQFVTFPTPEARDAVVLWIAHAHVCDAFESTPRLSVRSREPGSGKSRVLEVAEHMLPDPMYAVYITPGVMWRAMEHGRPTMMFDEADTVFGQNGSSSAHSYLRGIINAGHRKGATVPRCVGSDDVKQFHVFGPVILAGLGRLPETIANRSVEIVMRRRRKGDAPIRPFRFKFAEPELRKAFDALQQWSTRATEPLAYALPELPVTDRDADVWEPLVAIADLAGGDWPERARAACELLVAEAKDKPADSVGLRLLADLRTVFTASAAASMFTVDILGALYGLPDSPWSPESLTARKLSRLLGEYDVAPKVMRDGNDVARGYTRASLKGAWERYTS